MPPPYREPFRWYSRSRWGGDWFGFWTALRDLAAMGLNGTRRELQRVDAFAGDLIELEMAAASLH